MRPGTTKKLISGALLALVLSSLWFYFAPTSVGGSTSWVVTDGISMEPRFHAGDLVLVRAQGDYQVGQIVAYHSKALHTVVLHRIVGRAGSRYIFKGDNNSFVDLEHPARSQLIGALWLHLAGVGGRLESVRSPLLVGGLSALATLLFAGAAFTRRGRRRRRHGRAEGNTRPTPGQDRVQRMQLTILSCGLLALLPFACLALLAFTRPSEALLRTEAAYEQRGTLSYTARARPGQVYPGDLAQTGDPLFTHVVNLVALRFEYRFDAAQAHRLSGRIAMAATLQSVLGWRRTVPLGAAATFHGDRGFATATLNLSSLLSLIRSVETSTGMRSTYTLTLTPRVVSQGTLEGLPLRAGFAPTMAFSLDQLALQPLSPGAAGSAARSPASAFTRSSSGTASGKRSQAMQLSFAIMRVTVATAREISLSAVAVIACVIAAMLAFARPRRRDESAGIRARYGGLIIPVERVWQQPGVAVIDVAQIEALVRIAEHYDRSILHERTDYGEAFWVTDESGQFRYWIGVQENELTQLADTAGEEAQPEGPTEKLELPGSAASAAADADSAAALEFAVHAPGNGSARSPAAWKGGWESVGHSESVEHIEALPGVEPGPLLG